uniref:Carbohydrate sulfotransferase 9 n=1 Tax=Crocodylus porosus TaxID=8502 RepID=A0A7M4FCM9_CROPO
MVMNLRQVFVSVLAFGVAGILLFMYLQAWIEEQHTGKISVSTFRYLKTVTKFLPESFLLQTT